jgi:flagellar biosynthesis GTPase FlhF
MSWIQIQTSAYQWLITYKTKVLTTWFLNLFLDESIDNKKDKVWNLNPRPHEAQLEDQKPRKSLRRSSRRRKSRKTNKIIKSGKASQNSKEELRKAQNQNKTSNKSSNSKNSSWIYSP